MLKKFIVLLSLSGIAGTAALAAETSYLVETPSLGGGVYFASSSDENVLCQALGYGRAAVGSMSYEVRPSAEGKLISIDEFGDWSGSPLDQRVKSIVCVDWILPPVRATHRVSRPAHPRSKALFTASSDENGICDVAGFESGIPRTIVEGKNASGPRVTVDASGKITGGAPEGTPFVESVVCVSKAPSPIVELEPYFSRATRQTSCWTYDLSIRMKLDPEYARSAPNTWFDFPYRLSLPSGIEREDEISMAFFPTLQKFEDFTSVDSFLIDSRAGNAPSGKVTLRLGTVGNPLGTLSVPLPKRER